MVFNERVLELLEKANLTEDDIKESMKEIPDLTEKDIEDALDEMIREDATTKTPNDGDELIMHGVPMVWFKRYWIEKGLIEDLLKVIDGTYWVLRTASFPLMLWEDYPEENIGIELYGENLDSCIYWISKFRKSFDYRIEAWKYAEKGEDGEIADGILLDDYLYDQQERWYEILDLEKRIREFKRERDGEKISLSEEDIKSIRGILNDKEWRLYTNHGLPILWYKKHPKLTIQIPLFGTSILECAYEIQDYFSDLEMDKNVKGCLIKNVCMYIDEESKEAKTYRSQLHDFVLDSSILVSRLEASVYEGLGTET